MKLGLKPTNSTYNECTSLIYPAYQKRNITFTEKI